MMPGPSLSPSPASGIAEALAALVESQGAVASVAVPFLSALPGEATLDWPGLGAVRIRRRAPVALVPPPDEADVTLRLQGPWGEGHVVWQGAAAAWVLARSLGLPPARVLRAPTAFERGAMAALTTPVLAALGLERLVAVGLGPARPVAGDVALPVELSIGGRTAGLRLELPAPSPAVLRSDASLLAPMCVPLTLLAAVTQLTAADVAAARPGDAVVLEGVSAGCAPPPRFVRLGARVAPVRTAGDGALSVVGAFDAGGLAAAVPAAGHEAAPTQVIGALPIEVSVELARWTVRGAEALALVPGARLVVPEAISDEVALRIGAAPWGRGRLIDIDGVLAVRLVELGALGA